MAKKKSVVYVVEHEWNEGCDEQCYVTAVFTGKSAERRAERYADEERYELSRGIGTWAGIQKQVYGMELEGQDESDWQVDVKVQAISVNPRIPTRYASYRRRQKRSKEQA